MFKKLTLILSILSLSISLSFADNTGRIKGRMSGGFQGGLAGSFDESSRIKSMFPEGLIYYKNFKNSQSGDANSLNADFSDGSQVLSLECSRTANPATYIDSAGKINVSNADNVGLVSKGYYDTTGFNSRTVGLMNESEKTNYALNSYFSLGNSGSIPNSWGDGWSYNGTRILTLEDSSSIVNISGARWNRCQYIYHALDNGWENFFCTLYSPNDSIANGDTVTFSFIYTLTGNFDSTAKVDVRFFDNSSNDLQDFTATLPKSSIPVKFSMTVTATNVNTKRIRVNPIQFAGIAPTAGTTIDIKITAVQIEKSSYPTSFIPTTTAAGTRNDTIITGTIANNRNATETIFIKYSPEWAAASPAANNRLLSSDNDDRAIYFDYANDSFAFAPNLTDSSTAIVTSTYDPTINTPEVLTVLADSSSGLYSIYSNGVLKDISYSFTAPVMGTNWYLGCDNAGNSQLDGEIHSVSVFNNTFGNSIVDSNQGTITASMVDGTAFINDTGQSFSEYAGVSGVSKPYVLVAKNSSGYTAWGYIGEQGTGETLDGELLTNGNMEAGSPPTSWTASNATLSATAERTGGAGAQSINVNRTDTNGHASQKITIASGALLKISSWFKKINQNGQIYYSDAASTFTSGFYFSSYTDLSWTSHTDYGTTNLANGYFWIYTNIGNGSTQWDDVSIKQVLTPTANGVKIYSTKTGSTQSWAYKNSSFNANTITTYKIVKTDETGILNVVNILNQ